MTLDQLAQGLVGGLAIGCVYSLVALGFSMIVRSSGILHFAQGEMLMIGAMAGLSALWAGALPFWALILLGMIAGGLAGAVIEVGVYRPLRKLRVHHVNLVIATLGVSIVLQNAARLVYGSEPLPYPPVFGNTGLQLGSITVSPQLIVITFVGLTFMILLQLFFKCTRLGVAMQAAAQDPDTARLMGISVRRVTTLTFAISGAMAGAGGVLLGVLFFASFNMGFVVGIKGFVAATLGGLGSVPGAMVGGLLFGVIETYAGMIISTSYKDAVGMAVLIAILLLAPGGLFGRLDRKV